MLMSEWLNKPNTNIYNELDVIVLDIETTNKDKGSALNEENELLLVCNSNIPKGILHIDTYNINNIYNNINIYTSWGGIYDHPQLIDDVENKLLVAHNAKFELHWLRRMGADLSKVVVWDTMLAEYVILGNRKLPLNLGSVASRWGMPTKPAYTDLCMKGGVCPSDMPHSLLEGRCEYDVRTTHQLFLKQYEYCKENGLLGVVLTRCLLTPVLTDIEAQGMCLDKDRVTAQWEAVYTEYMEVEKELSLLVGEVNVNSGIQLGEYLYTTLGFKELVKRGKTVRTAKDRPKTDLATISKLKASTGAQREVQGLLLRSSSLNAQLTKALTKMKDCCEAGELLYAVFNQAVTATQRLSSSGTKYKIQFQNMARAHKPMITARYPGWKIGELDGSQLEFRGAAFLGQDEQAMQDIRDGVDVHQYTANTITDAGQDTNRQEAKGHTFKPLFGGTSGTKAEQAYYRAFKDKYKGIAAMQETWIATVLANKKLVTQTGLTFYWPDVKISGRGWVNHGTNISNYPIQSLSTADIIPIAIVYMWHRMREAEVESFIVNTVHDSVVTEIHPDEEQIITEIGIQSFTKDVYNYLKMVYNIDFNVPLGIGVKIGDHWSEGEEESYQMENV